jgi:peptidoglycan hydrolase FlgJ
MLKEIFVQSYYPQVKEAGIKYGINPVVLLAQIAIETGWGESVLCKEHFNFGGLTGFGKPSEFWPGTKVQLCEKGLTYRSYPDARSGILDMARLLRSSYASACNVSNVPAAYAQEIAYSRYISEVNGDNRDNYKQLLVKLSATLSKLIALQFPEHKD